jgi:hypothetical protein
MFPLYHIQFLLTPYKHHVIISDVLLLEESVSHVGCKEFLGLTHNTPGMIISGKKEVLIFRTHSTVNIL